MLCGLQAAAGCKAFCLNPLFFSFVILLIFVPLIDCVQWGVGGGSQFFSEHWDQPLPRGFTDVSRCAAAKEILERLVRKQEPLIVCGVYTWSEADTSPSLRTVSVLYDSWVGLGFFVVM